MFDTVLFIAFPYAAVMIAILMGLYRYYRDRFTYSSLSSQFLENLPTLLKVRKTMRILFCFCVGTPSPSTFASGFTYWLLSYLSSPE